MQIDRYTKAVLTVIAGALLVLAAENATRPSNAQSGSPQKVVICEYPTGLNCAGIVSG
jgi:hypothetical protein